MLDPRGINPYDGLYGYLFQGSGCGIFFRVGILLVEVYERVGRSVICLYERAQKGWQMNFMARFIKSRKRSIFVIDSC